MRCSQFSGGFQEILACWREAESLGFDTAWISDHFIGVTGTRPGEPERAATTRCDEGWTLLSALLARTSRIRGGIMVSGNTHRHPVLLAHMARTVDHISGGRLEVGLGTGWTEPEHHMFGWELPPMPERAIWLDEACTVIKRLWTEPEVTFHGSKYHLTRAVLEPKPVQQPYPHLVIGASGLKRTLRVVARHADEWNARVRSLEGYRAQVDALEGHLRDLGRHPASIQRSVSFNLEYLAESVSEASAEIHEYVKLGVRHLVFQLTGLLRTEQVQWLWRELIPVIRDRAGR